MPISSPRAQAGDRLGGGVHVGDLAVRADGHQRVEAGLDQAAVVRALAADFRGLLGHALLQLRVQLPQRLLGVPPLRDVQAVDADHALRGEVGRRTVGRHGRRR